MDGGAWKAAVHGVAEGRTQLSDFTFTFHFHTLEKEMATHPSVLAWRIPGMGEPGGLPSMGSHDWSDLAAAALHFFHFFSQIIQLQDSNREKLSQITKLFREKSQQVSQLDVHRHPLFFGFPSSLGHHRALSLEFPLLVYSRFSLVIYFIHSSVYMSIPISQFTPPPHSLLGIHTFVLYFWVSLPALQIS